MGTVYRRKDGPYWWTNFYDKEGNRVRISTKEKDKRKAARKAPELQFTYLKS